MATPAAIVSAADPVSVKSEIRQSPTPVPPPVVAAVGATTAKAATKRATPPPKAVPKKGATEANSVESSATSKDNKKDAKSESTATATPTPTPSASVSCTTNYVVAKAVRSFFKQEGFHCSADVFQALQEHTHEVLAVAMKTAKANGRKTVRSWDIRLSPPYCPPPSAEAGSTVTPNCPN